MTITTEASCIELADVGLAAGETLNIYYDERMNLRIEIAAHGGIVRSAYGTRTPESSDDLLAVCGKENTISVSTDGNVETTFEVRGRWL